MAIPATMQEDTGKAKEVLSEKKEENHVIDEWSASANLGDDIKQALTVGFPVSFGQGVRMMSGMILSVLLGRKDTYMLAGVSTSLVWIEPLDEMARGIGSVVSSLGAQAYGAGNMGLVGTWSQMSMILCTFVGIPIAGVKMLTGPILTFVGVPSIIADPAGEYALYTAFASIAELWTITLVGYLSAQALMGTDFVVACFQCVFGGLATWFAIDVLGVGIFGLSMVMNARRICHFILLILVAKVAFKGFEKCWPQPRWSEIFNKERWMILISLVIPAGLDYSLQKINGSVALAVAARLGQKQVGAFDLVTQLTLCINGPIWGLCMGFSILMAHRMGAGQPRRARGMCIAGAVVVYGVFVTLAILIYVCFPAYARFASKDPEVVEQMLIMRPFMSIGLVTSGGLLYMNEILVKQGRVVLVMISVAPVLWLIGMPLTILVAPHEGLLGIQMANTFAYTLAHILCIRHVLVSDWDEIAKQSGERSQALVAEK